MTTCTETLIVADDLAIKQHFNGAPQISALPALVNLENRHRHDVQERLTKATAGGTNAYAKGKRSFEILAKLTPDTLVKHLPSFRRSRRILDGKLNISR